VKAGSNAKGTALNGGDMGADVGTVERLAEAARTGKKSPWFDGGIKEIRPAFNSAVITAVAPKPAPCSVVVSTGRHWTPVWEQTGISPSALNVRVTATGLNPATSYWTKLECGEFRYEDRFHTP
jgi:hypothetical protein